MKKRIIMFLVIINVLAVSLFAQADERDAAAEHTAQDIIEELAVYYGTYGIDAEKETDIAVVSNAAYPAPSGTLSSMFQAGALIELSGDVETAFDIYYETYDIHELPDLTN